MVLYQLIGFPTYLCYLCPSQRQRALHLGIQTSESCLEAENQNNTYVKCQMTQARRASRADPEDGELRGKIISETLGLPPSWTISEHIGTYWT